MSTRDDVARLTPRPSPDKRLGAARAPRAIRAQTGLERRAVGDVESKEVTVKSTDGLFTFTVNVVES